MNRFFGMLLVIAATLAGLVVLSAGFYLAAGWLGWGFNALAGWITGSPGVSRAAVYYGASVANVLTLLLVVLMISASLLTVAERKWSALIQNRIGANRIKVFGSALGGIPFLAADALKMLTKERIETTGRTRVLYELAPMLAFAPVFALFAIIPVGQGIELNQIPGLAGAAASGAVEQIALQVSRTDTGLLYLFAIASLQVYGTALAGWASNNKLALLGGVRASSQMISYEVSLGLSLVGTMIAFRTLRLEEMVVAQGNPVLGPVPALGLLLQPIGFLIFFASAFAETKRAPFDLPEGESEIVGYFVEYSGMKFGLLFLAEFAEIVVLAGVITAVFLGGWHPILFEGWLRQNLTPFWFAAVGAGAFIAKMIVMMWLQLTIRWLLPRFRFDQIQKLCWKLLLPAALVNVFVTGGALLLDPSGQLLAWIGVLTIVVIAVLTAAVGRAPAPAAGHGAAHAAAGH
ncbi:NADH dehydrogenase (quinone) [Anaeromyxobacter sp. K]|uniref:complex I subunit 1/NuoH family protein n=1 Tax=Anaeromyxobacter sp. (strain K) TaxID=447217 RepID=UPI00015F8FF6|nr:complex I subunit 1 family protein [Anaeromyxobacter sp. K]ACG72516.1 NADH dehydrogenase (quinone) [Anaeromyxobacter sp. K]